MATTKVQTTVLSDGELRMVEIGLLRESAWNPRQYYPDGPLQELVESMRSSGFRPWLPVMARPRDNGTWFEIGAGHRRRRAAQIAGIKEVPCIVREMTDEEFLDVLNFDNTGREDVHPLHEAAGWQAWMQKTGKGVQDIAARIGQSKEYVYQRLKYGSLIEDARKAFMDGEYVTAGHAILIARLQPADQAKALKFCTPADWQKRQGIKVGVRALAEFIRQDIHLGMDEAKFDLGSETLVPSAGPCTTCLKRTRNMPDAPLVAGAEDECTDPGCFQGKVKAHLVQIEATLRSQEKNPVYVSTHYGQSKSGGPLQRSEYEIVDSKTPGAQVAIVVDGAEVGSIIHIKIIVEKPTRPASSPTAIYGVNASSALSKADKEKQEAERKAVAEREVAARRAILEAITAKVGGLARVDLEALVLMAAGQDDPDVLCALHGIPFKEYQGDIALEAALPKMREQDLHRLVVELPVAGEIDIHSISRPCDKLNALAKRFKVDAVKVRKDFAAASAPKPPAQPVKVSPVPATKTPAKKKAAAKAKAKARRAK